MKTLGTKITENRKLKKMTQEELANILNVSAQAVSKWENDLSIPDLPILIELADLFNVTLDELIRQQTPEVKIVDPGVRKPIEKMIMRVVVNGSEGDKVRVNLPMAVIKAAIEMKISFAEINGNDSLKNINLEQILHLVDQGVIGKLVEVESAEGDIVEVFVE